MPIYEVVLKVDGYEFREAVSADTALDAVDRAVEVHAGRGRIIEVEAVRIIKARS